MPRNGHVKVEGNREELGSYRYKDADKHWTKYRVNYICQTCKAGMGNETIEVEESHSWSDFDDLGHSGVHSHKYRLICKIAMAPVRFRLPATETRLVRMLLRGNN